MSPNTPDTAAKRPAHHGLPASERLPTTIDALPRDAERPAQTQFTRALQATFLRRLADSGEVRVAARALPVSHQTVYRMRRACRVFARGWDAALIVARERAEDTLASRAMHGVEEEVYYHGEVVAKRRRYDARLLLAHLARLDRKADNPDMAALAEDFDAVVDALEGRGPQGHGSAAFGSETHGSETHGPETIHERVPAQAGTSGDGAVTREAPAFAGAHNGFAGAREGGAGAHNGFVGVHEGGAEAFQESSGPRENHLEEALDCTPVTLPQAHREIPSGPCNMWSMSPRPGAAAAPDAVDAAGAFAGGDADERDADVLESGDALALEERLCAMEAARPPHALTPAELAHEAACLPGWAEEGARADAQDCARDGVDPFVRAAPPEIGEIEAAQLAAFEAGKAQWWRVISADGKALPPEGLTAEDLSAADLSAEQRAGS